MKICKSVCYCVSYMVAELMLSFQVVDPVAAAIAAHEESGGCRHDRSGKGLQAGCKTSMARTGRSGTSNAGSRCKTHAHRSSM